MSDHQSMRAETSGAKLFSPEWRSSYSRSQQLATAGSQDDVLGRRYPGCSLCLEQKSCFQSWDYNQWVSLYTQISWKCSFSEYKNSLADSVIDVNSTEFFLSFALCIRAHTYILTLAPLYTITILCIPKSTNERKERKTWNFTKESNKFLRKITEKNTMLDSYILIIFHTLLTEWCMP